MIPKGKFDVAALWLNRRGALPVLKGLDLAKRVTCAQSYRWDEMRWAWPDGYARQTEVKHKVVAVDYGAKRNILRCLASCGLRGDGFTRHGHCRRCSGP